MNLQDVVHSEHFIPCCLTHKSLWDLLLGSFVWPCVVLERTADDFLFFSLGLIYLVYKSPRNNEMPITFSNPKPKAKNGIIQIHSRKRERDKKKTKIWEAGTRKCLALLLDWWMYLIGSALNVSATVHLCGTKHRFPLSHAWPGTVSLQTRKS